MADKTAIEWSDATWNPIRARNLATGKVGWHCAHASEGCRNCYAEGFNHRLGTGLAYKPGHLGRDVELFVDEKMLLAPLKWKRPRKIFVCSMTDLFADFVPDEWIDRMFAVMALSPQHQFQVLTKRPERMREYLSAQAEGARHVTDHVDEWQTNGLIKPVMRDWIGSPGRPRPLRNVWLGVSVEDQKAADARIPDLLATPAAVRFLSCEPLLGPVDLEFVDLSIVEAREKEPSGLETVDALTGVHFDGEGSVEGVWGSPDPHIDWVIVGGESGPKARPMHPDWARLLRDQCAAAGVPFLFKQWGEHAPGEIAGEYLDPDRAAKGLSYFDGRWDECWSEPEGHRLDEPDVYRVGKKRAGRLLDGVQHDGFPEAGHA